jgi:hypothetical protein
VLVGFDKWRLLEAIASHRLGPITALDHSARMFASRLTRPYAAYCPRRKLPNSEPQTPTGKNPWAGSLFFSSGLVIARVYQVAVFEITSSGVFARG